MKLFEIFDRVNTDIKKTYKEIHNGIVVSFKLNNSHKYRLTFGYGDYKDNTVSITFTAAQKKIPNGNLDRTNFHEIFSFAGLLKNEIANMIKERKPAIVQISPADKELYNFYMKILPSFCNSVNYKIIETGHEIYLKPKVSKLNHN